MDINLTFLIQIGNFVVAFLVLRRYLLAPALALRALEIQKHTELELALEQERARVNTLQHEQQASLTAFQASFTPAYVKEPSPLANFDVDLSVTISKTEQEKSLANATQLLIERVPHVD